LVIEFVFELLDKCSLTFPKKVQLSKIRVAWVDSEVDKWINSKINQRMA